MSAGNLVINNVIINIDLWTNNISPSKSPGITNTPCIPSAVLPAQGMSHAQVHTHTHTHKMYQYVDVLGYIWSLPTQFLLIQHSFSHRQSPPRKLSSTVNLDLALHSYLHCSNLALPPINRVQILSQQGLHTTLTLSS